MEQIGWWGNILLALCIVPQAIKVVRNGHAKGMDYLSLWMGFIGEIMALTYHLSTNDRVPQVINYSVNIISLLIILLYRYFPTKDIRYERIDGDKGS